MRTARCGVVLIALLMIMPLVATAAPVTYDFTVEAIAGPLDGETASGFFTFDSAIIPVTPPFTVSGIGLFTDFEFTWDGITYTESEVNTAFLLFNTGGQLTSVLFGSNCSLGPGVQCAVLPGTNAWDISGVSGTAFLYSQAGATASFEGTVAVEQRAATVPEPASLALVTCAVAATTWIARRRRRR